MDRAPEKSEDAEEIEKLTEEEREFLDNDKMVINDVKESNMQNEDSDYNPERKKRKKLKDLTHQLPDRSTVAKYLADSSLISFADMADCIVKAESEGKCITYGTDDTVKAAGNKRHDAKTTHVTILDDDKKRETFTSGFYQNASHSGKSSAETVKHDVAKMAVLTNNTYRDILAMIDYFMTDRAGDADVMLDELDVPEEKRLKCNAHVLLAVDVALDKVFRDVETKVGVANLIGKGASHVFSSPKNSVWYLGLIALAKLLSPSHNAETISLFSSYTKYLGTIDDQSIKKNDFKGFISNRFGRIGELSSAVKRHINHIKNFFEEQVDENANKLVLAVFHFLKSDWFLTCCDVASYFYTDVILPIKELLGIDEYKSVKSDKRSWTGMKKEFERILDMLGDSIENHPSVDGISSLKLKASCSVKEALERQIDYVHFFKANDSQSINAPLTNLGCEANFSQFGNDCKKAGGSSKLRTLSDKNVVAKNKLFSKDRWTSLTEEEKRKKFKWARGSKEAKAVKKMEAEFELKIRSVEELATEARKKKKTDLNKKVLELLAKCKEHKGPLSANDISRLDTLSEENVMTEAKYLKKTIAPNLRFKRKEGKKFVKFTLEEIKQQIRDVIKPENSVCDNLEALLCSALANSRETSTEVFGKSDQELHKGPCVGSLGIWQGELGNKEVGLIIDSGILQLYREKRHGYVPWGLVQSIDEWTLVDELNDYFYTVNNNVVYLKVNS